MNHNKSFVLLTLCVLLWASNYVVGSIIVNEISPFWVTFLRWLLALFLLVPLANKVEKPVWKDVFKRWPAILLVSLSGLSVYNIVLYTALSHTSAINATLINTFSPSLMAIVSRLVLKERLSKMQMLGIVISLFGVFVVLSQGSLAILLAAKFNKGDLIMLLALSLWIAYTIIVKKINMPPYTLTAAAALFSTVLLFPFALTQSFDYAALSFGTIVAIFYVAIFISAISFVLWGIGVRDIGPARAGVFLNLMPVFTAIMSVMLGGKITFSQIVGGILVFIGVYFTTGLYNANKKETVK